MKTILKANKLELMKNGRNLVLLNKGKIVAKFDHENMLSAVLGLLALSAREKNKLAANKLVQHVQPTLF